MSLAIISLGIVFAILILTLWCILKISSDEEKLLYKLPKKDDSYKMDLYEVYREENLAHLKETNPGEAWISHEEEKRFVSAEEKRNAINGWKSFEGGGS